MNDVRVGDVWRTGMGNTFKVVATKTPLVELRSDSSGSVFQIGIGALIRCGVLVSRAAEPEERSFGCIAKGTEVSVPDQVWWVGKGDPDGPLVSLEESRRLQLIDYLSKRCGTVHDREPECPAPRILALAPLMPKHGW